MTALLDSDAGRWVLYQSAGAPDLLVLRVHETGYHAQPVDLQQVSRDPSLVGVYALRTYRYLVNNDVIDPGEVPADDVITWLGRAVDAAMARVGK